MILLEPQSKIIEETLRERFHGYRSLTSEPERSIVVLADFDGVTYRIATTEDKTAVIVSMAMLGYKELESYGAAQVLQREYGAYFQQQAESGYDVTLKVDLQSLPADTEPLVKSIALLKRNAMAAPFEAAFKAQQNQQNSPLMAVHYRPDEAIFIQAMPDRVTVIFSTEFKEETDKIYGKVFLQVFLINKEFADARRSIQMAPQVLYSNREPPMELRGVPGLKDSDNVGFVTFVLFPRHFQGTAGYDAISKIYQFRDYFHYHIKASKAYMHSRMRNRVDSFLKVLNRAKPEVQGEQKTASGKTFKKF